MGFGTLFVGYFLLLNITYPGFTDPIAATIMLMGLYKLSYLNKYFKLALGAASLFLLFSLGEMTVEALDLLGILKAEGLVNNLISIGRCAIIIALTVASMLAMREVAREVELDEVPAKCLSRIILTSLVYGFRILLETPLFSGLKILPLLYASVILLEIMVVILNLIVIHNCYRRICMPEDNVYTPREVKKSRFGFVNQYRERKAERARAEAEYRLQELEKKINKQKNRRKKK